MPKVCLEVPEMVDNISRPVTMEIIRQVASHVGLPANTPIRYGGGTGTLPLPGSTLDDRGADNRLPGDNNITIEANEEYVEENALSVGVLRPEHIVVFSDNALNVYLKPVYQRIKTEVNVKYSASDRTSANAWLQTMKRRMSQEFDEVVHRVNYHYPIPLPFIVILCEIHRLRELTAGYEEELGQWLRNCFSPKFTTITDQAGNNPLMVIRETQVAIQGWYDFNANPPKPEKDNESGPWSVSFTYTFHYDRPESMVMQYPLMIHNSVLDSRFRSDVKPAELDDVLSNPSLSLAALRDYTYEARMARAWMAYPGIPIPYFDDWMPKYETPGTQQLLRIMLQVDPDQPTDILNLGLLPGYSITPKALPYMRLYPGSLALPYESVFNISLHRKDAFMDCNSVVVTNDLDVRYSSPLNLREPYHLVVSLLYDINQLSIAARRRLCRFGEFAIEYLLTLDPTLKARGLLPMLLADGSIGYNELDRAIRYLNERQTFRRSNQVYFWNLVGRFTVVSHRS